MLPCLTPIQFSINIQGMSITHSYASRCRFDSIRLLILTLFSKLYTKLLVYKYTACIHHAEANFTTETRSQLCAAFGSVEGCYRTSICTRVQVFIFLVVSSIKTAHVHPVSLWENRWSIVPKKNTMYEWDLSEKNATVMQDMKAVTLARVEIISGGSSGLQQWVASLESTSKTPG